jgi:hypothetical protein
MSSRISIGTVAVAKYNTDACFIGELGVCYGSSDFEGQPVYGFIFETGRFVVFTAEGAAQTLTLTGRVCESVADYRYGGDAQLRMDFRAGRFNPAFPALKC